MSEWLQVNEFFATARERYTIRERRLLEKPWPWTNDPIFQEWRFCNVHREHDRVTEWLKENIRSQVLLPLRMVEAVLIFRWFNRIETGEAIIDLLLEGWDTEVARERLDDVQPIFTGAYIIYSPPGESKLDGIVRAIDLAREQLPVMVPLWGQTLRDAWFDLRKLYCMGSFTSYEVVTDLRWTPILSKAKDINTWAAAGPGCARGLGRVVKGDTELYRYGTAQDQALMLEIMEQLLSMSREEKFWPQQWNPWEMREVEHWACEFDKYMRAAEGYRLKRRYQMRTQ